MFFYFYDTFVLEKKYEPTLLQMESRIIELGINGRVEKLSPLKNMKEILTDGVKHGAHTVVVVGNDATFLRAISILALSNVIVGFIPFNEASTLGHLFGISSPLDACNVLSRRITVPVHLGKANQNFFLTSASITKTTLDNPLIIECDDNYTLTAQRAIDVLTIALMAKNKTIHSLYLELTATIKRGLLKKPATDRTALSANKILLNHTTEPIDVILDREVSIKTPVTITFKPKQVKIIMGKERKIT